MSMTIIKESLSDREQDALKKFILQTVIDTPNVQYIRGKSLGDHYFSFVKIGYELLMYRFDWRSIHDLEPVRNFPLKYVRDFPISRENIHLALKEKLGKYENVQRKVDGLEEAIVLERPLPPKHFLLDAQSFKQIVDVGRRFVGNVERLLGRPRELCCIFEHRSDDSRIFKITFKLHLQPRVYKAKYFIIGEMCKLYLWDEDTKEPDTSHLKFSHIDCEIETAINQLTILAKHHSFRNEVETVIAQGYNLEESEDVNGAYILGHWRSPTIFLTLTRKPEDDCVQLSFDITTDETRYQAKQDFICSKAMSTFVRRLFEMLSMTVKQFRLQLQKHIQLTRHPVVRTNRPMRFSNHIVEIDELLVMGVCSPPLCFLITYNFDKNKYHIQSQVGVSEGSLIEEICQYFSEGVVEYSVAESYSTPIQLKNATVSVKEWKTPAQLTHLTEIDLQPYDMLYLFKKDIVDRGMYLGKNEIVVTNKPSSHRPIRLEIRKLKEEYLRDSSRMLVVRAERPTPTQEQDIKGKLQNHPQLLTELETVAEGAINWLRWNLPKHRPLSTKFYQSVLKVCEASN